MKMDKPLCPYCGSWNGYPDGVEMLKGYNKHLIYYTCPSCDSIAPGIHFDKESEVEAQRWEDALAYALRRFQPMQKPLTLEKIQTTMVEPFPLWVELEDGRIFPVIIRNTRTIDESGFLIMGDYCGWTEDYNVEWRLWATCPKPKERDAAKWEEESHVEDR